MKQTAVKFLIDEISCRFIISEELRIAMYKAIEMEKNNTDNKAIHFAEWLTNKHTTTLITLYEHFEEQYQYHNETFKTE